MDKLIKDGPIKPDLNEFIKITPKDSPDYLNLEQEVKYKFKIEYLGEV